MLKLGHARHPEARLRHQLITDRQVIGVLLRKIPMPTGRQALQVEKRLHTRLRRDHPGAVIPPEQFQDALTVVSEIYAAGLEPVLQRHLDRVEQRLS